MRSRDEFLEKLHQQLRWLERSANEYDQGDVSEAIQMAARFRVLFHDKGRQVSVMTHLGMKSTLRNPEPRLFGRISFSRLPRRTAEHMWTQN